MVSYFPPCLKGLTFPSLPQWSHKVLHASPADPLPPMKEPLGLQCFHLLQWSHKVLQFHALTHTRNIHTSPQNQPFCGLYALLGTRARAFVSRHLSSREARWWPLCVEKMCVAVSYLHLQCLTAQYPLSGKETLGPTKRRIAEEKGGSE